MVVRVVVRRVVDVVGVRVGCHLDDGNWIGEAATTRNGARFLRCNGGAAWDW
jgi:hypothetical protein